MSGQSFGGPADGQSNAGQRAKAARLVLVDEYADWIGPGVLYMAPDARDSAHCAQTCHHCRTVSMYSCPAARESSIARWTAQKSDPTNWMAQPGLGRRGDPGSPPEQD
jgi:hypothetical protein